MKIATTGLVIATLLAACGSAQTATGESIEITDYLDAAEPESCAAFQATEDMILEHFRVAQPVTAALETGIPLT
ncbi:MAG: hypothetical protein ACK5JR_16465 [Tropicimonas sp.]|uniref:hypothetical protein n=1 Tax=Tropicimonas sp. TaxID=2067044 RepID=UPI003A8B1E7D